MHVRRREAPTVHHRVRLRFDHEALVAVADARGGVSVLEISTAGHDGPEVDGGAVRRVLGSAASGDVLVVPRPLRWWLRLSTEITKTLIVPVEALVRRRH